MSRSMKYQTIQHDMYAAVKKYMEQIKTSYKGFMDRGLSPVAGEMVEQFNKGLDFTIGKKYIKVVTREGHSVHSFIMREDDDKFKRGDILMAATWASPARNKARGNVFDSYKVDWTGPKYLVESYNVVSSKD